MLDKSYTKILRRACALMALSGFAFSTLAGATDPQKLGYRSITPNEATAVALLAQRILAGASSGDTYLYLNFMAKDYVEAAAGVTKTPGNRATPSTSSLESVTVQGHEATCTIIAKIDKDYGAQVHLHFAKRPEGWVLVKSEGLSQLVRAAAGSRQDHMSKAGAPSMPISLSHENEVAARTFIAKELSSEHRLDKVTRALTRERLQRNLFSMPHGSAFFASLRQFDTAPFIAASYVQLVTDPAWNRIVYGDYQKWIKAYTGDEGVKPLLRPHGLAVDVNGLVYVADTGNRRILVLKLSGPADQLELSYAGTLGGEELSQPTEVAWDDRSTIFDDSDDLIWVVDRGARALLAYRAKDLSAREQLAATPVVHHKSETWVTPAAIAVGRFDGRSDGNIYLADAGTRQLYRFYFDGQALIPVHAVSGEAEMVPASLATDHWGNVYLADAAYRRLQKFSANLTLLVTLEPEDETFQPARFQPLFGSVALPGRPEPFWSGYDQAFLLEQWSENSGGRRFELGIDFAVDDLRLVQDLSSLVLTGKLTDAGHLKTELVNDESNEPVRALHEGWNNAGGIQFSYDRRNFAGELIAPGNYKLRHTLQSTYDKPQIVRESAAFYLPLYYYEDCGATPGRDVHLIRGQRHASFGNEPDRTLAADPQAVIYRFAGLNPEVEYEVKANYFAPLGEVEQTLYAGQHSLHRAHVLSSGVSASDWIAIPGQAVADGRLDLRIVKTGGSGEASVAEIWLREAHFDANHPLQPGNTAAIPRQFALEQNYPNPFNPTTTISFSLPESFRGNVSLRIYNMLGVLVRELVQNDLAAGAYREVWDGLDASGRRVATGVYVYQLRAGGFSATRKLVMMK
ncbi:MAG: FlgD immunoglobulin-like domain containing protein [bacterium]